MKKLPLIVSVLLVVLIGGYIVYQKFFLGSVSDQNPIIGKQQDNSSNIQQNQVNNMMGSSTGMNPMMKNDSYIGDLVDAFYGPMQVEAVISSGKLTDIKLLQYPNDRGNTIRISDESLPVLKSEAIQKQTANVDIVSGATQTSEAFMKSLASALTKAGFENQPNGIKVTPPQKFDL
ncbi:MAG: hypothetical protein A3D35_01170 [Candidatus Staskawiczbacteria bacterium RIFCSPHIGHO2_02_FULL_34_9]|uniref:FMN-binding domain-containing protein n=1 Tax=Candidatus Staskawiczbacteria bacterium RIFCSPHIGHO2_02_FULL_34_9 TaxID=1802206 RepID=A0A1G2I1E9_9BACT|nr:MAG: hypothetical protein A3D35_01170 [Candidatus Staskawiczbacteria bacterium RIFCSPHIGHO2_02_FULL_34_9]